MPNLYVFSFSRLELAQLRCANNLMCCVGTARSAVPTQHIKSGKRRRRSLELFCEVANARSAFATSQNNSFCAAKPRQHPAREGAAAEHQTDSEMDRPARNKHLCIGYVPFGLDAGRIQYVFVF